MLADHCSHGIKWSCQCRECDLVSAREIEAHWGEKVDEARKVIAKAATKRINELKKGGFKL